MCPTVSEANLVAAVAKADFEVTLVSEYHAVVSAAVTARCTAEVES